jgi:sulfur carrier protein
MVVTVNSKPMQVEPGTTLRRLIDTLDLRHGPVAAEVNSALVPRREHDTFPLKDGDRVEVVTLVGGG